MVILVLGILMAIAIPMIGGVREAARNVKCRSNLKQLHTAVIAHTFGNEEEILPKIDRTNLEILVQGGYLDTDSKVGDCPGHTGKQALSSSSYRGGPDLNGSKSLADAGINSETVIMEDAETTYHKLGKNQINVAYTLSQDPKDFTPLAEVLQKPGVNINEGQYYQRRVLFGDDPKVGPAQYGNMSMLAIALANSYCGVAKDLLDQPGLDLSKKYNFTSPSIVPEEGWTAEQLCQHWAHSASNQDVQQQFQSILDKIRAYP